jgi:hypothetical protein
MNRNGTTGYLAALVPPVAYDALVLLLVAPQGPVTWLSLVVLNAAYAMTLVAQRGAPAGKLAPVIGYPLVYLAALYMFAELAVTTFILFVPSMANLAEGSGKTILAIQIVVTGIFAFVFLTTMTAGERIAQQEARETREFEYVRLVSAALKSAAAQITDPTLAKTAPQARRDRPLRSGRLTSGVARRRGAASWLAPRASAGSRRDGDSANLTSRLREIQDLVDDRNARVRLGQ